MSRSPSSVSDHRYCWPIRRRELVTWMLWLCTATSKGLDISPSNQDRRSSYQSTRSFKFVTVAFTLTICSSDVASRCAALMRVIPDARFDRVKMKAPQRNSYASTMRRRVKNQANMWRKAMYAARFGVVKHRYAASSFSAINDTPKAIELSSHSNTEPI